jgi:formylglycine-generating enzyme required for sulfatase activity
MEYNPSKFIGDDLPVENVSRQEIEVFLKKLNKHKRFSQTDLLLSIGDKYRLPTEKEWEYAAGGGDMITHGFYKYSGSNNIDEVAWCKKNSNETTHPVGYKEPNQIGIYDMSGNVWELCSDIDKHKPIAKSELNLGGIYVMKGGSCVSIASECEVPYRGSYADSSKSPYIGFRLACNY